MRAARARVVPGGAEMVFHVAGTLHSARIEVPLELGKNGFVALAHDVRQHVEATPVGHTNHRPIEVCLGSARQDGVKNRDGALGAFNAKPLCADVLRCEKAFEGLRRIESLKNPKFLIMLELNRRTFKASLHPFLFFSVLNVHVLNADLAAIRIAQNAE